MSCANTLFDRATIPSEMIVENALKVSTRSSIDSATIQGVTQAVTSSLSINSGDSVCYEISAAGAILIKEVYADGLTVKHVKNVTGSITSTGWSNGLNLSIDSDFIAYYSVLSDPIFTDDDVLVAGDSPFSVGVFTNDKAYIVLTNDTGADVNTEVSIILLPTGSFQTPYGLKSDTQLIASTEMSDYG